MRAVHQKNQKGAPIPTQRLLRAPVDALSSDVLYHANGEFSWPEQGCHFFSTIPKEAQAIVTHCRNRPETM
jgi:hypothetical protein